MPFKQVVGIVLILVLFILGADTKIDLQSRSKNPNFSTMTGTFPFQVGTSLPVTCVVGQSYFRTNVTAGLNLFSCTSTNIWTCMSCGSSGGGGGLITWQTDGSQSALEQVANFKSGTGILLTGTNPAGKYQLQVDYDPATLPALDGIQSGIVLYIRSTSGNDTYAGCPAHTITGYTRGMFVVLDGDTVNTGAATINLCSLGAKSILNRAGGALSDGDITANKPIFLGYDGTQFDILGDGGGAQLTAAAPISVVNNVITLAFQPTIFYEWDEFMPGALFGGSTVKSKLLWTQFESAGNGGDFTPVAGLPGTYRIQTSTANNDTSGIALDGSLFFTTFTVYAIGTAVFHEQRIIHTDVNQGVVTSTSYELGWASAETYRSTNSIAIRYDTTAQTCTAGVNSTTAFILETISGGNSNCVTTGVAVADNKTYILDLSGDGTTITAKISSDNGATFSSPVTSSTSVPSAALFPKFLLTTRTTAARELYVDRWEMLITGLTRP